MRPKVCLFDYCKNGYLDRDPSTLDPQERKHVKLYHKPVTCPIGLHGALFIFRRDPSRDNQYVCVCDALLSSTDSLKLHVLGSTRPSNNKGPCTEISAKAIEIAQTREIFHDEEKPINYEPVDPKPAVPHRNKQQGMKSLDDEEDEELDLNNDEDEEAEESDDIQRLLEEND
ncbi:hypothetical protein BGZ89_006711, partial [Linnemannia elongata]